MAGKAKIILSDTHIGAGFAEAGNVLEDFTSDAEFVDLLHDLVTESNAQQLDMELIFAGDFLEMLQVPAAHPFDPYEKYERMQYRAADVQSVLTKMEQIFEGHPGVWAGLSDFLRENSPRRTVTILWGNHDPELYWPEIQQRIRQVLNASDELADLVQFQTHIEGRDGIYVEHGNQYAENYNRLSDFAQPLDPKDASRIEHPPGSRFVINFVNDMERERPWIDGVHPLTGLVWYGLQYDFPFAIRALAAFLREAPVLLDRGVAAADAGEASRLLLEVEDPARVAEIQRQYQEDATFRSEFHRRILQAFEDGGLESHPPPAITAAATDDTVTAASLAARFEDHGLQALRDAADQKARETGAQVVVMGHTHVPEVSSLPSGATYANCGTWVWRGDFSQAGAETWRDLFENPDTYSEQRDLTYIRIDYDENDVPRAALKRYEEAPPPIGDEPAPPRPGCLGMLLGRR